MTIHHMNRRMLPYDNLWAGIRLRMVANWPQVASSLGGRMPRACDLV